MDECGSGKSGAKYCYYNCLKKKKNRTCRKRAVRKDWLVRAVEAGIFNTAAKTRMDELEQQQRELETALADAELVSGLRLTQEHIKFFLLQFRQLNFEEPESQRRIIDIFVNAVFVYDDRVTITFNYSSDNRTITLPEADAAAAGVRGLGDTGHQTEGHPSGCPSVFCSSQTKRDIPLLETSPQRSLTSQPSS